jgi:tetratricopeptide (TPR) repeat protein
MRFACVLLFATSCMMLCAQEPVPGPKDAPTANDAARQEAMLRAVREVAPETTPAATDAAHPILFAEPIAGLMTAVVTGSPDASKVALAKLVDDRENGPAALTRLQERGALVLARCITAHLQEKLATNAIYFGQFEELRDYMPEAAGLLLAWAAKPAKDAPDTSAYRATCLRALRDVLPAEQGTDGIRNELRSILTKARTAGDESLYVTCACTLHQFGDTGPFDQLKASVAQNAADEKSPDRVSALNTLAELHYQLGQFAAAAGYYKSLLEASEQAGQATERLATLAYNLACSLALAGKSDDAFEYLDKALTMAAKGRLLSKAMIDEDHDMNNLRADPRFRDVVRKHFGGTAQRDR